VIAFYFSLRAVTNAAVRPIIPTLSRRYTRSGVLAVSLLVVGATLVAMPLVASRWGIGAAVAVFGAAGGLYATLAAAAVAAGFTTEAAGVAMGTRMLASRIGIIVGPVLLGVLVETGGLGASFVASGAIMLASAVPYLRRPSLAAARARRQAARMDAPSSGGDGDD
jgi:predicted MFS family arabinose efflux permease